MGLEFQAIHCASNFSKLEYGNQFNFVRLIVLSIPALDFLFFYV
jgi:hypothetical protein